MKILLAGVPENETERRTAVLRNAYPDAEFVVASTDEEQMEKIRDADAYYGWPSREVYLAAEKLRWVHCPGTGIDQITKIPELVESDVVVTNTKGPHVAPMADHVMGMIVMLAHRWRELMEDQRLHRWETGQVPQHLPSARRVHHGNPGRGRHRRRRRPQGPRLRHENLRRRRPAA